MDYQGIFENAVDALRQEKRYRVFADLERIAGRFPKAVYRDAQDNAREITIWCSNDYLGQGQNPVIIEAAREAASKMGAPQPLLSLPALSRSMSMRVRSGPLVTSRTRCADVQAYQHNDAARSTALSKACSSSAWNREPGRS